MLNEDAKNLTQNLVSYLDDKKMAGVTAINLESVNPYFCVFVIATANSSAQLKTISRDIQKRFGEYLPVKGLRTEDIESGWVIFDFIDVVLHLFLKEQRDYYNLEKLWGDAPVVFSDVKPA